MIALADLLPDDGTLSLLDSVRVQSMWLDPSKSPPWGSVFLQGNDEWVVLEWDYADVQFKFEMYGLSIERLASQPGLERVPVATEFFVGPIRYLVQTAWLRPAAPGEVPEGYEPVLEESGSMAQMPPSALVGGVVLRGIAFTDSSGEVTGVIGVDDERSYSLIWMTEGATIRSFLHACDSYDLDGLCEWRRLNALASSSLSG